MGNRLRKALLGALVCVLSVVGLGSSAIALSASGDRQLAQAGVLVAADLPAGFTSTPANTSSDAEVAKIAKRISSCAAYVAFQKSFNAQPNAKSRDFEDADRQVSNDVGAFKTARAAGAALALYGKTSVPKCLQPVLAKLFTQEFAKQASTKGKIASVKVTLARQPISGVGDASVVYEGNALVTGKDGSSQQIGLGNAAIQVGRTVDDFTYTTTGADLTTVIQPAIGASLARLQTALTTS